MISFLIALSIVFSSVLAAIIGECVATLPGNYTLAALNTTLPNTNATGLPLMVAHTSTDHSFMFYQIVTRASYRYSDIVPDLTLSAYGLIAKGPSNHASVADLASETRLPVTLYETSSSLPEIVPAPVFCAMPPLNADADGCYRLVAKDSAPRSLWKICPDARTPTWVKSVLYNATQDGYGYKLADCFDVELFLIPSTSA